MLETEHEDNGRWLAEGASAPGRAQLRRNGFRSTIQDNRPRITVIAERVEKGEPLPRELAGMFQLA